jgi:carboxypeptidase family protein/TonB-dependent receptor-like protein
MTRRIVHVALVGLCLTALAVPASAQVYTGRIDVTAKDGTGAILPGVTVELGGIQNATAVTDTRGEAHFLNLAPGRYTVTAKLSGFNDYKNDNVPVGAGGIVPLDVTMTVGGVSEKVEVTAQTPIIEAKKQTVSTNVSLDELQNIPSSRDPWVVLQTVPGIVVDRVNVGGAESGQQSNFQAKGASDDDNTWNMDGIAITDMGAVGSSPTYYDFDMFQEMQVTTGGADPANPTPGVQLNFVLRSGTNRWRGSTRYYFENNDLQSDNLPDDAIAKGLQSYNRNNKYRDYGVEGGGPAIKDKLFVWGAYGKTNPQMDIFTFQAAPTTNGVQGSDNCTGFGFIDAPGGSYNLTARDCTTLENYSAKASYNFNTNTRASFTYFRGNKEKAGRGAANDRPAETTYNQTGPTDLYKGEVNYTLNNATFLTARYAYIGGGFSLTPVGGLTARGWQDDEGINHGTYFFYETDRPQNNFQIEGNHFRGAHELKFGFGYRKASVTSQSGFPGGIRTFFNGYPDLDVTLIRNWAFAGSGVYWSAFGGDQISLGRLTVNLGLRWDRQIANITEASVPSNDLTPLLPALSAPAHDSIIVYNTLTPRLGLTYAVNESRRTIVRASYGMFASQLASNRGINVSQIPYYSYVYYEARDLNGNNVADPDEFGAFLGTAGFDPNNPLGGNPDKIGNYKTPKTHEFLAGLEHEVVPNFGISGNFTYRKYIDFNWLQYNGLTSADYTLAGTFEGTDPIVGSFSVPYYTFPSSELPSDRQRLDEHRRGYSQRYLGFELAATKRMSNNWMMRLGFSTNDHREYFDGPDAKGDPTPTIVSATSVVPGPQKDGGLVMVTTSGSGKSAIYMVLPKYQFIATGAYQAKWDINLGINYVMRQGYASPYYQTRVPGTADVLNANGKSLLLVGDVGANRLDTVHSIDVRINKGFRFQNRYALNFDLDIFNIGNVATELGRIFDRRLTTFNQVREIMNPRIIRLGVRLGF